MASGRLHGFYQGQDRGNSVQFLIIRNRPTDQFLVAGYRVVEGAAKRRLSPYPISH